MSSIARWSYKSVAKIRPLISMDDWSGQKSYGAEYEILCNFAAIETQEKSGSDGLEKVLKHEVFTEDPRPNQFDLIQLSGIEGWEEIVEKTGWDMALFNDTMDFKLLTG